MKPILIFPLALIFVGCATTKRPERAEIPPPIVVAPQMVEIAPDPNETVTLPSGQRMQLHQTQPIPVWQSARIQRVYMAGHTNERGEAYYRSQKEVIVEPGQWNLDALNHPQQSYIPEANTVPIPTAPGRNYTHMVSPGPVRAQGLETMEVLGTKNMLEGLSDVRILSLMERSQEPIARQYENDESTVVFYENLGWCLVPREGLLPTKMLPNG